MTKCPLKRWSLQIKYYNVNHSCGYSFRNTLLNTFRNVENVKIMYKIKVFERMDWIILNGRNSEHLFVSKDKTLAPYNQNGARFKLNRVNIYTKIYSLYIEKEI